MHSLKTFAVALLLAVVANKSHARPHDTSNNRTVLDESGLDGFDGDLHRRWQGYELKRRDSGSVIPLCRALCSSSSCNDGACDTGNPSRKEKLVKKTFPSLSESPADEKLGKRALNPLDEGDLTAVASYMVDKFTSGQVTPLRFDTSGTELSTSTLITVSRKQSFNLGAQMLCGCTLLVVVSERAMYMAHIFEPSGFNPYKKSTFTAAEGFQSNIIDFLNNGRLQNPSLKGSKRYFDPSDGRGSVIAFIISPSKEVSPPVDDDQEPEKAGPMEYYNGLYINPRCITLRDVSYDAINAGNVAGLEILANTMSGKVLFEYDENGIQDDDTGTAVARLICENFIVDTFRWSKFGIQADDIPDDPEERSVEVVDAEELPRVKRGSSSITELVWDQSTVVLPSTTSIVTVTGVPIILQSNGIVIKNQTFTLPPGQANTVVVAQGLNLTIEQVPAPTQTVASRPGPGTSTAASFTPTPTPLSTSVIPIQTRLSTGLTTARIPSSTTALIPASVFSWPTVITTVITTTDASGVETLTVTATNSSGVIVPIIPISPAQASESAAALAAELAAVSAAVAALTADTAAGAAGTAALGAIQAAQSSADAFGLGLGTAAGLCLIFCDAAADAAVALGSLETTVGGIVAGTTGAGALTGLAALLGGLTAAADSLSEESTPNSASTAASSTAAPSSTSSCSTVTVTDFEILCGTGVIDGYISTTVCSTITSSVITGCSATAAATTTYEAAFCPIGTLTPRIPVQILLDGEDIITETIFCGSPPVCSNCTGTLVDGQATCAVDGPGLGCPCIPDSQTPGFTCPPAASCDAANCTGAFNITDGKAYCTGYPAGCECIETATTCGAETSCDSNDCAGAFNLTDGKAYCTGYFDGCQCQATTNTCGQPASCDGSNCQGAFNLTDGKAYCTNFFEGCECTSTTNTCGAPGSCDSNDCNGAFNMADGKSYCTNHFAGCECQATTNTCGQPASCDGSNCQGVFNLDDGKSYCSNFFDGCECTPTANTCGAQASCDSNDCDGAFNMADGKAYCTNHFAGCECTPTGNTCGGSASCDDNNCAGAFDMGSGNAYCTNFFQGCQCTPTDNTCGSHGSCDDNDCNGAWNNGIAYCTGHFTGCQCSPTDNTCGAHASCDDNGCNGAFNGDNGIAYCTGDYAGCQCNPTGNTCGAPQRCENNGCAGSVDDHSSQYATCKGNYAGCSCIASAYTVGYCGELDLCSFGTCAGHVPSGSNFGLCSAGKYLGCGCLKQLGGGGSGASNGGSLPPNLPCSAIPGCAMTPGAPVTCKTAECQFIDGADSVGTQMGVDCSCVCSDGTRWETDSYAPPGSDCTPSGGDGGAEETLDILCSLFGLLDDFLGICPGGGH